MSISAGESERAERMAFILALRQLGVRDVAVLRAMELVPRPLFLDPQFRAYAYENIVLPLPCGQTMSQPGLVAKMTEFLNVTAEHIVLEVGMGSGYQTAVLSHLGSRVVSVDRYRRLVSEAQARFEVLGLRNIASYMCDGLLGVPARAPYDRIMVTGSAPDIPEALVEQLRFGGVLVMPIGPADGEQKLVRFVKQQSGHQRTELMTVRFAPLMRGTAAAL